MLLYIGQYELSIEDVSLRGADGFVEVTLSCRKIAIDNESQSTEKFIYTFGLAYTKGLRIGSSQQNELQLQDDNKVQPIHAIILLKNARSVQPIIKDLSTTDSCG